MPKRIRGMKQVREIRQAFRVIEKALVGMTRQMSRKPKGSSTEPRVRRTLKISAKRRAQLELQGRYMGYMRQLKPRQKSRIKTVKIKNGYTAAIRLAKQLANQ